MAYPLILLALTGLPLKFHGAPWAQTLMTMLGGVDVARFLHRLAEASPGASLEVEAARELALAEVGTRFGLVTEDLEEVFA